MQRVTKIIASFCGMGYITSIAATWTSLLITIAAWFLSDGWIVYALVVFTIAGFAVCKGSRKAFGSEDPQQFVIDEVCGQLVTLLLIPKSLPYYIAAFLLFRLFDVWKPWLIGMIQRAKGAWSIMADDLLAGVFANLVLQAALIFLKP